MFLGPFTSLLLLNKLCNWLAILILIPPETWSKNWFLWLVPDWEKLKVSLTVCVNVPSENLGKVKLWAILSILGYVWGNLHKDPLRDLWTKKSSELVKKFFKYLFLLRTSLKPLYMKCFFSLGICSLFYLIFGRRFAPKNKMTLQKLSNITLKLSKKHFNNS